jgi:hypothetical protein
MRRRCETCGRRFRYPGLSYNEMEPALSDHFTWGHGLTLMGRLPATELQTLAWIAVYNEMVAAQDDFWGPKMLLVASTNRELLRRMGLDPDEFGNEDEVHVGAENNITGGADRQSQTGSPEYSVPLADLAIEQILDAASSEAANERALREASGENLDDAIRVASTSGAVVERTSNGSWLDRWRWGNEPSSGETQFVQILTVGVQADLAIAWAVRPLTRTPVAVIVPGPVVEELVDSIRRDAADGTAAGLTAGALLIEVPKQRVIRFPPHLMTRPDSGAELFEMSIDDWSWDGDGTAVVSDYQGLRVAGITLANSASVVWGIGQDGDLIALVAPTDLVRELHRRWTERLKDPLEAAKEPLNLIVSAPVTRLFPVPVEVLSGHQTQEANGMLSGSTQAIAASLDDVSS